MFWGRLDQNSGVHGNRKPPLTYNGENGVSTFSRLLLIQSFLCLQVTRTCIKSRTSLNFGQIGPLTTELAALECLKNFPLTYNGKMVSHFRVTCPWVMKLSHFWTWISLKPAGQSWSNFICSIIEVGKRLHKILGQIDLGTLDSGERSLPFGLLVWLVHKLNLSWCKGIKLSWFFSNLGSNVAVLCQSLCRFHFEFVYFFRDASLNQFASFWTPVVNLDRKVW